jgi:hypothetical protein
VNTYSDPTVVKAVPFAKELLAAAQAGQTPPSSPYWHNAERAINATWAPLSGVRVGKTPRKSEAAIVDAVGGGL